MERHLQRPGQLAGALSAGFAARQLHYPSGSGTSAVVPSPAGALVPLPAGANGALVCLPADSSGISDARPLATVTNQVQRQSADASFEKGTQRVFIGSMYLLALFI